MDEPVIYADIEEIIDRELPQIPGWCTPEKGKRMASLALGTQLCVELGVFGGRGLVALALPLALQGSGRAHGVDPFTAAASIDGTNDPANNEWWSALDYEAIARSAQETLYRLDLVRHAQIIRMRSVDVVGFYRDKSVDLIHADSNHSQEISCAEVELWAPKIKVGGFWIADDTNWPSTQTAQKLLAERGFVRVEDHDTWAVFRKEA